jgi:hypothetical protein
MTNTNDICSNRHGGNEQSQAANNRNKQHREAQRRQVYELIKQSPRTMKEVAEAMGVQLNTVSGRGSELKQRSLIEPTGEVRGGSAVLRAIVPQPTPVASQQKPTTPEWINDRTAYLAAASDLLIALGRVLQEVK